MWLVRFTEGRLNVAAIREAYGLNKADLARALSCAPLSVSRWERGDEPTGIYRTVLRAMEAAAATADESTRHANGAVLATLGVGEFIRLRIQRMIPD